MNDQADNLRRAIKKLDQAAVLEAPSVSHPQRISPAKVFTVTSGKGGVGKTNISINLAIALCEMGYRVAVIDADFGLANVEVLFGAIPKYTLLDVIHNEKTISEVLCEGPRGISFISGGSGVEEIIRLGSDQIASLVANLSVIDNDFDIIIIDTGAGISETVIGMALAADEVLLVTTPEPTAITDAYALIKALFQRDRDRVIRVIVNRAESEKEATEIMAKLSQVSEKFLDLELLKLGYIPNDAVVIRSVKRQMPFIVGFPNSASSRNTQQIARTLMNCEQYQETKSGKGLSGFISKISRVFTMQSK